MRTLKMMKEESEAHDKGLLWAFERLCPRNIHTLKS